MQKEICDYTNHALTSLALVKGVSLLGHWPSYKKFQGHPRATRAKNLHTLKVAVVETAPSGDSVTTCDHCVFFLKSSVECSKPPL